MFTTSQLLIICGLTFIIHLVGTLAYAARIAGVRTRRVAVSFALFNILVLVSRTSNSFQAPFLGKRVETTLGTGPAPLEYFRWFLVSATVATVVGMALIPTFQRVFSRAVVAFQATRSLPRLLWQNCSLTGVGQLRESFAWPSAAHWTRSAPPISGQMLTLNVLAVALWTVGVFAPLYAAYLDPQLRVTSSNLSAIVNGLATILMFIIIDPHLSILTDDAVEGRLSEPAFRRAIVWLAGSRFAGTLLAQFLLVPAATLIVWVARWL